MAASCGSPSTAEDSPTLIWRAAGVGVLAAAWALNSAWWRRWRERWQYGSPKAGIMLAAERWDRHRRKI